MSSLDPCDFPIGSSVTDGGDKPFCPDESLVNALYRLNSTGDPMILEALHLDEGGRLLLHTSRLVSGHKTSTERGANWPLETAHRLLSHPVFLLERK